MYLADVLVLSFLMETPAARSPLTDLRIVGGNLALNSSTPAAAPGTARPMASGCPAMKTSRPGAAAPASPNPALRPAKPRHPRPCSQHSHGCRRAGTTCTRSSSRSPTAQRHPRLPLRRLQLAYVEALAHGQLTGDTEGFAWKWDPGSGPLAPLWPIVAAAVELLTHGPADRIKSCHACRFMFIDQSKNSSRRWCSMEDCGKAAKIARYLQHRSDAQVR